MTTQPTWQKSWNGASPTYTLVNGPCEATLAKVAGKWQLTTPGHEPINLGKRATFDHAETALQQLLAR